MNSYAVMVGSNGTMWEWGQWGQYAECTAPDNGTAGWFLENFRNLLAMEEGSDLWLARATPRAWLEQGKSIVVRNAPTYFGPVAYEIVSHVLRLRHPQASPIKSVTLNGQEWREFNPDKEVIQLTGVRGKATVVATY